MNATETPIHGVGVRLALHACCGPCAIEPLEAFLADGHAVTLVFYNPNIQPADEYQRRRDALVDYAQGSDVDVVELVYDPAVWRRATAGWDCAQERCRACYRLRLGEVARWAVAHGYDALSTTLTVSPYQDGEAIAAVGSDVAAATGVAYLARDFTDRYAQASRRSREAGMYRQNYCGCIPSREEAEHQRAERKAARERDRAKRDSFES